MAKKKKSSTSDRIANATKTVKPGKTGKAGNKKKQKGPVREWIDALAFALIVMIIVRTLLFDLFKIPTPSMEKNLLVGDYLFVSKLHYGTRTPITLGIPFTKISFFELPNTRLPGFSHVKRGDAIVFNYPEERERPIDRREHYIKRVIGVPGDRVEVVDKVVHLNGVAQPLEEGMQQHWSVVKKDERYRLSQSALKELGVSDHLAAGQGIDIVQGTEEAARAIEEWPWVERVEPAPDNNRRTDMYPPNAVNAVDNYKMVEVPKQDSTYVLSAENWPYFEPVIRLVEGHSTGRTDNGGFLVDGQQVRTYTFSQDYFFVMGDNRNDSLDSRFWGFVPMNHVVGKAVMLYWSWAADEDVPLLNGRPRINRMFSLIR